ncbi:MAG: NAD(P)H-binding protein [Candidatus Acidiferrales bacterium]
MEKEFDVVTGAFGYSGAAIARKLLARGRAVRTLTNHAKPGHPLSGRVEVASLNFTDVAGLRKSLEGADVLYNTYWIRFAYGGMTYERAVENSRVLIRAAKDAGVRRIVHVSIANYSDDSPLGYYAGKAQVVRAIQESGLRYGILCPTVIFGNGGILINNIAWLLRRLPFFAIPNNSNCRMQPIFVEDMADLMVRAGAQTENTIEDAVGPEIYSFKDLLKLLGKILNQKVRILRVSPRLLGVMVKPLDWLTGDIVLQPWEIEGLAANVLVSKRAPLGWTKLSEWLTLNSDKAGEKYISELQTHFRNQN